MARMIEVARGIPIWVWGRTVTAEAQAQLEKLARQPYVVGHIAAMPDLHVASGVAVGSVFATERFIVPSALGGDLGCGVSAVHFAAQASGLDLRRVFAEWSARIPVGDAVHRGRQGEAFEAPLSTQALEHQRERLAPKHLGTLGGGNHFVELDRDASGELWLLVHSGSRGLGAAIGAHHAKAAEARGVGSIPGLDLASPEGQACLADTAWALAFAAANRRALVAAASEAITAQTGLAADDAIDVHHNFVAQEGGRWIHRKGAIPAAAGARVLIPGSMGTASYVAEGLGEALSFRSASHGAGRVMTRKQAHERIPPQRFRHSMRRVVHDERKSSLVEEAPAAYREIGEVLEDEADLVRPQRRLEPLVVLKG
ncbi:MAG TPA: RtcB family protein [Myxococcales bacterium]|jgi:tRNA-splicing ligase RtcB|nr:RtcB family protein [Myxococcales bacterium]